MSVTPRISHADQSGFTIVELLVAMVAGVIVTGALFAVLEMSLHQTSRITDRVQASQLGRIALTRMTNELQSACIAREFTPVLAKSKYNELRFVSAASEKAVIGLEPGEVQEHHLIWAKTYTYSGGLLKYTFGEWPKGGYLLDVIYNAKGGTWPKFEFPEAEKPTRVVRISENVYEQSVTKNKVLEEVPMFAFSEYAKTSATGAEQAADTLTPLTPTASEVKEGLGEAEAKKVAAVQISFVQAPANNYTALNRSAELSSTVGFAFTSPHTESTITDAPCQ